jgi:hypothetical protein
LGYRYCFKEWIHGDALSRRRRRHVTAVADDARLGDEDRAKVFGANARIAYRL